jgi:two-component system, OmpR family, sensor histidine kinase BaeS
MRKLRTQLSLTIMMTVLFTIAVISLLSNIIINREFEVYKAEQQRKKADNIVANFNNQYNINTNEWNIEYIHGMGMYALYDGYIIKLYDGNGKIVWDAQNHDMAMCTQIMHEITERMEARRPGISGEFILHEYDLTIDGQKIGSMAISYYGPFFLNESDFRFLDTLNIVLIIIGVISLFLSLCIGGLLAGRITRPIRKTVYIAKRISEGNYSIRFEGRTKFKELDELATAINCLTDGLSKQENLRKRLTVDIAHELRTPLTTLASHLEAMIEGVWEPSVDRLQSCYEEIGRLSGLVADLERLAKTESDNLVLNKSNVDIMDIAHSCYDRYEIEAKKKNISLVIEGDSSIVPADKDRMSQVMANLLTNAIKYTPENGHIRIIVKDTINSSIFMIEDDGIGIPKQELSLIFERFYRTDKSRNRKTGGAGIGLAIVKSIVTAHGGTVKAESNEEQGSIFAVTLPKKEGDANL